MRLRLLIAVAASVLLLFALLPLGSQGAGPRDAATVQKKIETTRGKIGKRKGTERVLSSDIAQYTRRIDRLQDRIGGLQTREQRVQAALDRNRAELGRLQRRLREERARLTRLRARLTETRRALSDRLVQLYQADRPDLVTVVLNADGFADLLERGEFLQRINDQDQRIVTIVRDAKADATATAKRLDRLEERQAAVTAAVQRQRDELAALKQGLIDTRVGYEATKEGKARALANVREERHELEGNLVALEREQRQIRATLARAAAARSASAGGGGGGGSVAAGPVRQGSGRFVWPVNGPITGVFGEARPGHMHAGLDIAAPEGTPIRAADSGRVVLMGWTGGYGNYTCIQHTSSLASCYAHQSRYGTSAGANVSKGQVIGYVGNTGHSFGAHLHFEARVGGTPVNPMGYL
jgi:murein DD-endopeptidase MepM/ murein hydrolase activator NlpD